MSSPNPNTTYTCKGCGVVFLKPTALGSCALCKQVTGIRKDADDGLYGTIDKSDDTNNASALFNQDDVEKGILAVAPSLLKSAHETITAAIDILQDWSKSPDSSSKKFVKDHLLHYMGIIDEYKVGTVTSDLMDSVYRSVNENRPIDATLKDSLTKSNTLKTAIALVQLRSANLTKIEFTPELCDAAVFQAITASLSARFDSDAFISSAKDLTAIEKCSADFAATLFINTPDLSPGIDSDDDSDDGSTIVDDSDNNGNSNDDDDSADSVSDTRVTVTPITKDNISMILSNKDGDTDVPIYMVDDTSGNPYKTAHYLVNRYVNTGVTVGFLAAKAGASVQSIEFNDRYMTLESLTVDSVETLLDSKKNTSGMAFLEVTSSIMDVIRNNFSEVETEDDIPAYNLIVYDTSNGTFQPRGIFVKCDDDKVHLLLNARDDSTSVETLIGYDNLYFDKKDLNVNGLQAKYEKALEELKGGAAAPSASDGLEPTAVEPAPGGLPPSGDKSDTPDLQNLTKKIAKEITGKYPKNATSSDYIFVYSNDGKDKLGLLQKMSDSEKSIVLVSNENGKEVVKNKNWPPANKLFKYNKNELDAKQAVQGTNELFFI